MSRRTPSRVVSLSRRLPLARTSPSSSRVASSSSSSSRVDHRASPSRIARARSPSPSNHSSCTRRPLPRRGRTRGDRPTETDLDRGPAPRVGPARRRHIASIDVVDRRRRARPRDERRTRARETVDILNRDVVRRGRANGDGDDARASSSSSSSSTARGRWRHRAREAMGANVGRGHRARRWERRGGRYVNGVK